jgi:hypothetical protein
MSSNIKIIRLKKHNWFVCLFSKKKREERKQWEKRFRCNADPIEINPMKYEPHPLFYMDYEYKNIKGNTNE